MKNQRPLKKPAKRPPQFSDKQKNFIIWLLVMLGVVYVLSSISTGPLGKAQAELPYSKFYEILIKNPTTSDIVSVTMVENVLLGRFSNGSRFTVNVPQEDPDLIRLLRTNVPNFEIQPPKTLLSNLFYYLGPTVLFIAFLWFFVYRSAAQGGGRIWSFGKAHARQLSEEQLKVTFSDVAGVDEAKEELKEAIEFLKDPKRFQRLGGKMPKGVLLMGPPGCGKTLLARAVAGEASVPFLHISGSDFVEMFVGVGASRVRDLFGQAKRYVKQSQKGCIIFIDEIDAVGRQRFAGIGGGHDEREQTLNALLVEMDGFDTQEGVILVAATNRPDVLDPALLRPGRFDRQIVIDRPDIKGREDILKVHTKKIKLAPNVDLKIIARRTPGFSGADLANLANEAALLAARRNKEHVEMEELEESIERVMAGPERKSRIISDYEKKIVAYHESGHALLMLLLPNTDPLHKVSIIPRGAAALGYTLQVPLEDRYITTRTEILARLAVLLGGRASEEMMFNEMTTGAHSDLEITTEVARKMVTQFGMSEKLGHLTFGKRHEEIFLGRDIMETKNYSDETAQIIDEEVKKIVDSCYERAKNELTAHKDKLQLLAETLLEREVLEGDEVKKLLGLQETKKS